MKKQVRFGKLAASLLLVAVMILSLASCGSGQAKADDASGTHGALTWSYTKDNKTLTISGSGDMAGFENADAVVWVDVRTSAETLVVSEGITSVGNYAFYYMPNLKSVTLPSTLTSIGDYGFGYCNALASITVPNGLTSLGKGAFEGCGSLSSVFLPASVNAIGERAFAYCYSMTGVIVTGEPAAIGSETFLNCKKLDHLVFRTTMTEDRIAPDAFKGAKKGFADAIKTDNATGASLITVRYMQDGAELTEMRKELSYAYGTDYAINTPTREGFTPDVLTVTGKADGAAHEYVVTYTANAPAETEAPVETQPVAENEEGVTASGIVAIVIMAVVLIAIGVGAFLLFRSDKKTAKKGSAAKNAQTKKKNGK